MRRGIIFYTVVVCILLFPAYAYSRIPVPERTNSWVNDYADIIPDDTQLYIEKLISSIRQKTPDPVEIVVATFKSLEGWNVERFASRYGEKWRRIKRGGRDNGVIMLVALEEGRVLIGVGQNLKGILTNEVTNNIVNNIIAPEFKKGYYSTGIKRAVEQIIGILDKAEIPSNRYALILARILLFMLLLIGAFLFRKHLLLRKNKQ